jgi:hypothetical protein
MALCCGRSSASASVAASLEDLRPLGAAPHTAPPSWPTPHHHQHPHQHPHDQLTPAPHSADGSEVQGGELGPQQPPLPPPLAVTAPAGLAGGAGGGAPQRSWLQLPPAAAPCAACEARQRWRRHPHDPQHLVVNGGGGAFLHPTHVFAGARFPAPDDPAAEATAGLYAAVALPCTCG